MKKKPLIVVLSVLLAVVVCINGFFYIRECIWNYQYEHYTVPRIPDEAIFEKYYEAHSQQTCYEVAPSKETNWVSYSLWIPDQKDRSCYCTASSILIDDGEGGTARTKTGCLYSVNAGIHKGTVSRYLITSQSKAGTAFSRPVYEFDLDPEGNLLDAEQFSEKEITEINQMIPELKEIIERIKCYFHIVDET